MSKLLSDLFPANGGSSLREMKPISLAPLDSFCILLSVVVKKYQEDKEIGNNTQGRKQFPRSMTCKDRIHRKKEKVAFTEC